jgi:hypothetical protein
MGRLSEPQFQLLSRASEHLSGRRISEMMKRKIKKSVNFSRRRSVLSTDEEISAGRRAVSLSAAELRFR